MAVRPYRNGFRVLSLCTGLGGLDEAVRLAIPSAVAVCCVEIEAFAAARLVEAMQAGEVAPAALWSDLKTFDGKPWRGRVHCVIGGYPCTPFSVAGKQRGEDDPRHLWPHVARIVREVEPPFVFFENVGNHLRLGFAQVHDDLESMGYETSCGLFQASEVGAPHRRERLFILAHAKGWGVRQRLGKRSAASIGTKPGAEDAGESTVVHPASGRIQGNGDIAKGDGERVHYSGRTGETVPDVADADATGRSGPGLHLPQRQPRDAVSDASRTGGPLGEAQSGGRGQADRAERPAAGCGPTGCVDGAGGVVGDVDDAGRGERRVAEPGGEELAASESAGDLADATSEATGGLSIRAGEELARSGDGSSLPYWPPGPADREAWQSVLDLDPLLAPALSRASLWRTALEQTQAELGPLRPGDVRHVRLWKRKTKSLFRALADGCWRDRIDWLRGLGNAVVPAQGCVALITLWQSLFGRDSDPAGVVW